MSEAPLTSPLEAHLGYWLRSVSNAVSQSFSRKVEAHGVTVAEWVFLRVLYDADALSPSELADRMGMTRGAISKLAERLIDKSLIERRANPDDGRAQTLGLNSAGRALVPELAALADRNDAEFFSALSAKDRRHMERILKTIASQRNLDNPPTT